MGQPALPSHGRHLHEFCIPTFGAGEGRLGSLAAVATVVFVKGQTVLASPRHHVSVGLQVLGAGQALGPVDLAGVCVRHVQLTSHRIGCQVVAVRRVVTAFKTGASVKYYILSAASALHPPEDFSLNYTSCIEEKKSSNGADSPPKQSYM